MRRAGQTKYLSPCVLYSLLSSCWKRRNSFKLLQKSFPYCNQVNSLFTVSKLWISSSLCIFSKCLCLLFHMHIGGCPTDPKLQYIECIIPCSCDMDNMDSCRIAEFVVQGFKNTPQRQQHHIHYMGLTTFSGSAELDIPKLSEFPSHNLKLKGNWQLQ